MQGFGLSMKENEKRLTSWKPCAVGASRGVRRGAGRVGDVRRRGQWDVGASQADHVEIDMIRARYRIPVQIRQRDVFLDLRTLETVTVLAEELKIGSTLQIFVIEVFSRIFFQQAKSQTQSVSLYEPRVKPSAIP